MKNRAAGFRSITFAAALAAAALIGAVVRPASAQDDYVRQFPQGGQVLADWKGADATQTALRQWGALYQLRTILTVMSRGRAMRGQLSPAEAQVLQSYVAAQGFVAQPNLSDPAARAKYFSQRTEYELSTTFREHLLVRYFTPEFRSEFKQLVAAQDARLDAYRRAQAAAAAQLPAPARRGGGSGGNLLTRAFGFVGGVVGRMIPFALAIVLLVLVGIPGKGELDPANPALAHLGDATYELESVTGTVRGKEHDIVVKTNVSGGGGYVPAGGPGYVAPVTTTHTTTEHLNFFIHTADGRDLGIETRNLGFRVADGQVVSAIRTSTGGSNPKPVLLMLRNHSSGAVAPVKRGIHTLVTKKHGAIRWLGVGLFLLSLPYWLVPVIPTAIVSAILRSRRTARVSRELAERFVPLLDRKAAAIPVA